MNKKEILTAIDMTVARALFECRVLAQHDKPLACQVEEGLVNAAFPIKEGLLDEARKQDPFVDLFSDSGVSEFFAKFGIRQLRQ